MTYWADLKLAVINGAAVCRLREPVLTNRIQHAGILATLVVCIILILLFGDWLANQDAPRRFTPGGFHRVFVVLAGIALTAWLMSRRLQNYTIDFLGQALTHLLFLLGVAALAWVIMINVLPENRIQMVLKWLLTIYLIIAAGVYAWRSLGWVEQLPGPSWRGTAFGFLLLPIYLSATQLYWFNGNAFWWPANYPEVEPSLAQETVLLRQQNIMQQILAQLPPQEIGKTDTYFVSYAPDATQDVFKRETDVVQKVMRERFALQGKEVRMINHRATTGLFPAATYLHLQAVLNKIGQLMNREEDVLVLYITAHGSKNFELSAHLGQSELINITPQNLRELLDKANIQNRVLIVSACYSGGFITPLKNDRTLIMTASANDRTSFGCSNESDFTYFGRAIFDEQLRKTHSFEKAFAQALPDIASREQKLGAEVLPSNPQISVGSSIKLVLAKLEAQLQAPFVESPLPTASVAAIATASSIGAKSKVSKKASRKKTKTKQVN